MSGAELADGERTRTTLASPCTPPCSIPTSPTFTCALLGAYTGYSLTFLPGSCVRATGDWVKQRSHRLERALQVNATAGLAACEQTAQSASL